MNTTEHEICLLLGSNIEPERNIPRAIELLRERMNILRVSSAWESASVDCCYPDYVNLALLVSSPFDAEQLKQLVLRPLEAHMGRVRTEDKNAPRPIDFDILLFDGELLDPDLWQHVHRAMPVSELLPTYTSRDGETLEIAANRMAETSPIQLRKDIIVSLTGNS